MNTTYVTGTVRSKDGTIIGFKQFGKGEGLILVHGGMQASQNFTELAAILSDEFTVYVPDRRGRGLSGPFGEQYDIEKECEDLRALIGVTGSQNIFGLSSGAIISLQTALTTKLIKKIALYEPPLQIANSEYSPLEWMPRYEREIEKNKLGAALATVMKGTGGASFMERLPRFILVPLLNLFCKMEQDSGEPDNVPIKKLIPTWHYDASFVLETAGLLETASNIEAKVLLLGGSKSPAFLQEALNALSSMLPDAERVDYKGFGHTMPANDGNPELVAKDLRRFFRTL